MTPGSLSAQGQVWRFAVPVILANISTTLLGLADTAVLGRLSSTAFLGAVAIGSSLLHLLLWIFGFLRMGTTGEVSRAWGKQDGQRARDWLVQSLSLALVLGGLVSLTATPLLTALVPFFKPDVAVEPWVMPYCTVRLLAAPATLANYVVLGWLLGCQRAGAPLVLLVFQNLLNIVLDLFFVVGLGMTVTGVALASVLAEYASLGLGLVLCWRVCGGLSGRLRWSGAVTLSGLAVLVTVNRQLLVRNLCLLSVFLLFVLWGSHEGAAVLAVNALLLNFFFLSSQVLDGFAFAAEALVGRALGAGRPGQVVSVLWATLLSSTLLSVLLSLITALGGEALLRLLTDIPGLAAQAAQFLPFLVALPVLGVICFWLDGVFIGLGLTGLMQGTMMLSTCLVFVPLGYGTRFMGNEGLWLALCAFMLVRSASMLGCFVPEMGRLSGSCCRSEGTLSSQ
ncbi:MAG: MATE family efflux transporter [Kistimonas sp.]|nr:MATE family efflux transporter [Kistimonas sp.]